MAIATIEAGRRSAILPALLPYSRAWSKLEWTRDGRPALALEHRAGDAPPPGVVFPGLTQPRYPAELYEAVLVLGLAGLLFFLRERPHAPGTLGLTFLVLYPLVRAGVDVARINLGGWPTGDQVASLAVAALAGVALATRTVREPARPAVAPDALSRVAGAPSGGHARHTLDGE